jgi:succinyl-CoA synthetase beta subunit
VNLHEHQAKELLSSYGVPIQRGMVVENIDQLQSISHKVKKILGQIG